MTLSGKKGNADDLDSYDFSTNGRTWQLPAVAPADTTRRWMMRRLSDWRRALPKNRFVQRVLVLAGGTFFSQAVLVASAPLLTRIYTGEDFGLMAMFITLLSLVSVVGALRYEQAIPIPEDDKEAASLLMLSVLALIVVCTVTAIPLMMYRDVIAGLLNLPRLADYMLLVPVGALLAGLYNIVNRWALRMKDFGAIARTRMSQSLLTVAIQLAGMKFGALALLVGQVAGHSCGSVSLFIRALRTQLPVMRSVRLSDIAAAARRHRQYPIFSTWGALFNTAGSHLPSVMFAALFGPAAAGMYLLANRVLSAPMQLLGQAIGNVFYVDAPQASREGRLGMLVANVHGRLAHIGMPPAVILIVAGPELFGLVFGEQWRQAGVFAQWLAPWLYLVFITSPLTSIILVLERQAAGMVFQAGLLIVRVLSIAAGAWLGDLLTAVALFALGSATCWLANLAWLLRSTGNAWNQVLLPALGALAWALALASPLIIGTAMRADETLWMLVIASVLITTRYAYLMKSAWS